MPCNLSNIILMVTSFWMTFSRLGGRLWLDLVNTVEGTGVARVDRLSSDSAVVAWLRESGLDAGADPTAIAALLRLRESLRGAIDALLSGADEDVLIAAVAAWQPFRLERRLMRRREGWAFADTLVADPRDACAAIAWNCAQSVAGGEAARLKRCAGDGCVQLFVDDSRNGSRYWCSMKLCGNRDKVARWRARGGGRPATG